MPHITLKSIANNAEIDVIHERLQPEVEAALAALNAALKGHPHHFTIATGGRKGKAVRFDAAESETAELPSGETAAAGKLLEWEVPREAPADWPEGSHPAIERFWEARIARQREIDASIAAKADCEYLYDKPYEDRKTVRVAGPFTVESLSPHRELKVDEDGEFVERVAEDKAFYGRETDFAQIVLENLKTAGVQQADKQGRIRFNSLLPWPGELICADARYLEAAGEDLGEGLRSGDSATPLRSAQNDEGALRVAQNDGWQAQRKSPSGRVGCGGRARQEVEPEAYMDVFTASAAPHPARRRRIEATSDRRSDEGIAAPKNDVAERRAGVFIGPEFGTVSRVDLAEAAREAAEAGFDVLIACAFNFDAHASEFDKLGRIPVLKARMNADLHMAGDLKNTGKGNLFVIFGEPDIEIREIPAAEEAEKEGQLQVKLKGVDVFHPQSGDIRSSGPDDIACWFIDTDYDGESFFVRHAYFLGANDPYKSLKTSLKAEIDREAWDTLHSDLSRPFPKPATGRIAVKVINHLGDEAIKVFRV